MSMSKRIRTLTLPALFLCTALPAACKSTEGHDRAARTADHVVLVGGTAGQAQVYLDKTLDSLGRIVETKSQDPTPAFKAFTSGFSSYKNEFAALGEQRKALSATAESWFTEFEKQNGAIHDEDLRATGAKRLAGFREQVADTSKSIDELIAGAGSLELRLADLRRYLGNDLSAAGIEAVSGKISDVSKDGRKLAARLGELSKSSGPLADKLRAARKPAPAPAAAEN